MTRAIADILFVGSIPGPSVEAVMKSCAENVGDQAIGYPDGELGERNTWIMFLAPTVFQQHSDIETLTQLETAPNNPNVGSTEYVGPAWTFRIRPGVKKLRFEKLGYADYALSSYHTFTKLREAGSIPDGVRFQVCLPIIESIFRWFFPEEKDFTLMHEAIFECMQRELANIVSNIPASDLMIQWDVCAEVLAVEVNDFTGQIPFGYNPPSTPMERYTKDIKELSQLIPEGVLLGIHLCYGDLGHKHFIEPTDLRNVINMANEAVRVSRNRPIDFFHVPVPRSRDDDDYFKPLEDLNIGDAKIFIGLVHYTDGVDGTRKRLATAKRHITKSTKFGISTECGYGRRPLEQVAELMKIHVEVASEIRT